MAVRVEKNEHVTTVVHSRPKARNAMDPDSANALVDAFLAFEADDNAYVAVLWGDDLTWGDKWFGMSGLVPAIADRKAGY